MVVHTGLDEIYIFNLQLLKQNETVDGEQNGLNFSWPNPSAQPLVAPVVVQPAVEYCQSRITSLAKAV